MTTAAPLLSPVIFDELSQHHDEASTHRSWKRTYPARPGFAHGTAHATRKNANHDELCDMWGCSPEEQSQDDQTAYPSSPILSSAATVTSLLTWDDCDVYSHLGSDAVKTATNPDDSTNEPVIASSFPRILLEDLAQSITYAPFCDPASRRSRSNNRPRPHSGKRPSRSAGLGPVRGRMVAVGLQDGTTILYQSRRSTESDNTFADISIDIASTVSATGSSSPSQLPPNFSDLSRLSITDQDLLTASIGSLGRNHSRISVSRDAGQAISGMSFANSFGSTAALSTLSFGSTNISASGALQIDEGSPATMVETNVTAVGQSVRSPTHDAEHALEAQKVAADRNEHSHGIFGGVIEALGFGNHGRNTSEAFGPGSSAASSTSKRKPGPSVESKRGSASGKPQLADPSAFSSLEVSRRASVSEASKQKQHLRESASASDSELRPLLRFCDPDRSAVVALRLYQTETKAQSSIPSLLAVHAEGRVSSWSLEDGSQIWQIDLSQRKAGAAAEEEETASNSVEHSIYDSLTPIFLQLGTSASTTKNTATSSLRGSTKVDPRQRGAGAGSLLLRDGSAVRLASDVRMLVVHGRSVALIRDQHMSQLYCIDVQTGSVVTCDDLEDCIPTCSPSIRLDSGQECQISWIQCSGRLQSKTFLFSLSDNTPEAKLSTLSIEAETKAGEDKQEATEGVLPAIEDVESFSSLIFANRRLFGISNSIVRMWKLTEGKLVELGVAQIEHVTGLVRVDQDQVVFKTEDGVAEWELNESKAAQTSSSPAPFKQVVMLRDDDDQALTQQYLGCGAFEGQSSRLQLTRWNTGSGYAECLLPASDPSTASSKGVSTVTAILPISMERIVVALSSGHLTIVSLSEMTQSDKLVPRSASSVGPERTIVLLRQALDPRSGKKVIVGGTNQGGIAFWDATTLALQAAWSLSNSPIETFISFGDQDNAIRLHGCIACVAADSSVSVILLDGLKLLHSIPGRDAKLHCLAVRADELLLTYDDNKARVWDMRSQELRRSIGTDQAQALVEDGKGWWSVREIVPFSSLDSGTSGVLSSISCARGSTATTLLADFRRSIEVASRVVNPPSPSQFATMKDEPSSDPVKQLEGIGAQSKGLNTNAPGARKALNILRPLLALALPLGIDDTADARACEILGLDDPKQLSTSAASMGLESLESLLQPIGEKPVDLWTTSSLVTTQRALICVAALRVLAGIQDLFVPATELCDYVTNDLTAVVGSAFKDFFLPSLILYTLDCNAELQGAAKVLFEASLSRMDQDEVESLCKAWQPLLPFNQPPMMGDDAPVALALLGSVAVERYKSISPKLLKEIAMSISIFIADEARPMHQAIAIDLCRCGFSIWQHYFDATEIVRALFSLATNKEPSAVAENRSLARDATLQIASENTPLFMTTLSLDILHARSPSHCSATMRLVALMVRKKPMVLYPNLPRLAEAVVKSLDPTVTAMREAVVQAATVMITELVNTYATIAFHGKQQRLAVGTHEGAIIMYDLKTATRLYVIEGHRKQLTGCSFSPDGRRLLTVSLEEKKLLIWKVGNTFTSMFTPGVMPRQGGTGDSGAYRSIDFNVGDAAAVMRDEDELRAVSFDWSNDRSVRVKLGEAQVSLSVD